MDSPYRHIQVQREGDVLCVRLVQHQLDDPTIRAMSSEIDSLIESEKCRKLILCLGPLKCLYSVLIAKLIKLRRNLAERGGALKICDLTEEAYSVLQSCQLHDYFDIVPDASTALAGFGR